MSVYRSEAAHSYTFFHITDIAVFHLYAFDYMEIKQRAKRTHEMRMQKSMSHAIFNVSPKDRVGVKNYSTIANK